MKQQRDWPNEWLKRKQRLAAAGLRQVVLWVPQTTKAALAAEAARRGLPLLAIASTALECGAARRTAKRDTALGHETTAAPT